MDYFDREVFRARFSGSCSGLAASAVVNRRPSNRLAFNEFPVGSRTCGDANEILGKMAFQRRAIDG